MPEFGQRSEYAEGEEACDKDIYNTALAWVVIDWIIFCVLMLLVVYYAIIMRGNKAAFIDRLKSTKVRTGKRPVIHHCSYKQLLSGLVSVSGNDCLLLQKFLGF